MGDWTARYLGYLVDKPPGYSRYSYAYLVNKSARYLGYLVELPDRQEL